MRYADLYAKMEKHSAKRLNVVNPYSDSIYEALKSAVERDWVIPVLFGEEKRIREKVKSFDIKNVEIISADSPENAAEMAVKDISNGSGHLLMKGDIPTALFMKPVLNKEWGLRKG
ncbi:MAG: phosphate butyryltransferase, partial [Candidatus Marinimicrobia bacterium]|nr:phosphate butyryltransferase [Candidatus Neomarinimicrobiota bacterium]